MSSIDARRFARSLTLAALLIGAVGPQVGCVALNIPSERLYDATDHGGMFGDWRKHRHIADSSHAGHPNHHELHAHHGQVSHHGQDGIFHADRSHCSDPNCVLDHHAIDAQGTYDARFMIDGGPLEQDPFGPIEGANGAASQPEIPWPRFHPVPTRPVFGVSNH